MNKAAAEDDCYAAGVREVFDIPDASDEGEADGPDVQGVDPQAAAPKQKKRRHVTKVQLEGEHRSYLIAFDESADARASIDANFRDKKPTYVKLVVTALQLTGWRRSSDGLVHEPSLDRFAVLSATHAQEVMHLRAKIAEMEIAVAAVLAEAQQRVAAAQQQLAAEQLAFAAEQKSPEEKRELRRTEAQLAEVDCQRRRAVSAEAAAHEMEVRAAKAEQACAKALERLKVLETAPSRAEARRQAEESRRCSEAAAAERITQLEDLARALRGEWLGATERCTELETMVRSEQTRRGNATAELEKANAKLAKVEAAAQDTTLRNLQRREAGRVAELTAARAEVAELHARVKQLEAAPHGKRGMASQQHMQPLRVRTSDHADAPFSARSLEFMCRLVDESNGSFEGAATANALVLGMHYGVDMPDSMLYSSGTLRNAFHRVGIAAQEADATRNRADRGPWCIAQDAGGGTLMVATGHWDAEAQQPEARPLSASDLFRDQGARNGINTLERAAERGGLNFGRCVGSCSDGTEHAAQESQGFCELTHERAKAMAGPDGQRAAARGRPLAQADLCCIHGKALEENGGMRAAFPDNHLVDALRLLWELVCGPEGRPSQYRKIWAEQVARADGTILPALPVAFFDQNLKALTEPTEAKWQVMFDACYCLSPLLEPFGDVLQISARRCYLEIFFEKCLTLFCGSTDQEKAKRVTHPHILKLQLLHGIFGKPEVYTAINLTIDAWEQNYQAFHSFARSPSAYGGFAPPFLRHMMAEQAAKDVVWYRAARARPREHLPKTYRFITSSRWRDHAEMMTAGVRSGLEARAAAFLEAAEAKCLKWNGSSRSWLRARYLFGILCVESRRRW